MMLFPTKDCPDEVNQSNVEAEKLEAYFDTWFFPTLLKDNLTIPLDPGVDKKIQGTYLLRKEGLSDDRVVASSFESCSDDLKNTSSHLVELFPPYVSSSPPGVHDVLATPPSYDSTSSSNISEESAAVKMDQECNSDMSFTIFENVETANAFEEFQEVFTELDNMEDRDLLSKASEEVSLEAAEISSNKDNKDTGPVEMIADEQSFKSLDAQFSFLSIADQNKQMCDNGIKEGKKVDDLVYGESISLEHVQDLSQTNDASESDLEFSDVLDVKYEDHCPSNLEVHSANPQSESDNSQFDFEEIFESCRMDGNATSFVEEMDGVKELKVDYVAIYSSQPVNNDEPHCLESNLIIQEGFEELKANSIDMEEKNMIAQGNELKTDEYDSGSEPEKTLDSDSKNKLATVEEPMHLNDNASQEVEHLADISKNSETKQSTQKEVKSPMEADACEESPHLHKNMDDFLPIQFSGPFSISGPMVFSGPISCGRSISRRSEGSSASTRSFAFPVIPFEWGSPVRMPPADPRYFQQKKRWYLTCLCCGPPPTLP